MFGCATKDESDLLHFLLRFLRHSSLLRYLADGDDELTRERVNSIFAGFGGAASAQ
jgi:hypothetical protein